MERNVGSIDRALRLIIGVVMMGVGFGALSGGGGVALGVIGAVLFVTGAMGRCLLYAPFGFNTYLRVK